MNQRLIAGLVSLEAQLDQVLFAEEMPEKKRRGMGGMIAAPVAAGVGAMALRKRYGADQIEGVGNQARATMAGARREVGDVVQRGREAIKTGKASYRASRNLAKKGMMGSVMGAIKKGAGKFMMSAQGQQLQELNAKLDEVLEFAEDQNYVRRALLGGPISSATVAPKGQKLKAFKEQYKHSVKETGKGAVQGVGPGALVGAGLGVGAMIGRVNKGKPGKAMNLITKKAGRKVLGKRAAIAAGLGAAGGAYAGALVRGAKGGFGSNEIHQKAKRGELK